MAVTTQIPLSEKEAIIYKRFVNLSVNEEPKPQGEGTIRISPFDDYFIFTIFDETDGADTPIDLSNVGTIYIVFVGESDEVRIANYTNLENINMAAGQVLFKIDAVDAKRILALSNRNFYISTMMVDTSGESDESVLYTGTFLTFAEEAKVSLSKKLEEARLQYTKEIGGLQTQVDTLLSNNKQKEQLIGEQLVVIKALKESNTNLLNEITVLSASVGSAKAELLIAESTAAQKGEDLAKIQRQQIESIGKAAESASTGAKQKAHFKQAARQLIKNMPGVNRVTIDANKTYNSNNT